MSEKITYVLSLFGETKAVIFASTEKELGQKTALAIQEEEALEEDSNIVVGLPSSTLEWGEPTDIVATYMDNEKKTTNTDYVLTKTVSY